MCARRKAAVNCVEIAQRVLARYPQATLEKAIAAYEYDSNAAPEDRQMWDDFRGRGYMTLSELKRLSLWKARGRQQVNIASNSDPAVKAVTEAAIQVNSEVPDESALPIGILTTLHGVEIPTASTIMTVWDPQRFGILDIRVWRALRKAAPDAFRQIEFPPNGSRKGYRLPFGPNDAALYLCVIREIAAQTSLSCREIDKALWVLGDDL